MIGVFGSLAEYERELIEERTALKRQASRPTAPHSVGPRKVDDADHIATAKRMKPRGTAKDIAKYLRVSRATLYRYLVPRVGSDFTVRLWDNDVCLLLLRWFFGPVMRRG